MRDETEPQTNGSVPIETERGAGLAEYGMLLLFILVVCLGAIGTLGTTIETFFTTVGGSLFN